MDSPLKQPDLLPPEHLTLLQEFGVWIGLGVAVLVLLIVLRLVMSRLGRKPKRVDPEAGLREDLADYPPAPGEPGPKRLTVEGVPVRVRLIVVAPAGQQPGVAVDRIEEFLDQLVRGLGPIVQQDRPRVRPWPAHLSLRGFAPTFHRLVMMPDPVGEPSHWVLLAGPVKIGKFTVLLGLAVYADQASTLGRLVLEPEQWARMLRVEKREE